MLGKNKERVKTKGQLKQHYDSEEKDSTQKPSRSDRRQQGPKRNPSGKWMAQEVDVSCSGSTGSFFVHDLESNLPETGFHL